MALIRPIPKTSGYSSNIPLYWVNCGKSATGNNTGYYYDSNKTVTDLTAGNHVTGEYFDFTVQNQSSYVVTCKKAATFNKFDLDTNTYSQIPYAVNDTFTVQLTDKFIIWLE